MNDHGGPQTEIERLERKKLVVLAGKAIERSRRLIEGSFHAVDRARRNCDTARNLHKELSARRKPA